MRLIPYWAQHHPWIPINVVKNRATNTIKEETQPMIEINTKARTQTSTQCFGVCIHGRRKHFVSNHFISLDDRQKSKFLDVLREHNKALGRTIINIKRIILIDCMHYIYLVENDKPTRKLEHRQNPNMKGVSRAEVLKLLDAIIVYPISNSNNNN